MNKHILLSNGTFYTINAENELEHHGVKGMKWGVRRAQKRAEKANRRISRLETLRKQNKLEYDEMREDSKAIYNGNSKKLRKSLAGDKALYNTTEVQNRYAIAKQKAIIDKTYKQSSEYQDAKKAFDKQYTQQMIFGTVGHQRIETLKNLGYSEKKAKGRTFVEELAAGVAVGALIAGYSVLKNRY